MHPFCIWVGRQHVQLRIRSSSADGVVPCRFGNFSLAGCRTPNRSGQHASCPLTSRAWWSASAVACAQTWTTSRISWSASAARLRTSWPMTLAPVPLLFHKPAVHGGSCCQGMQSTDVQRDILPAGLLQACLHEGSAQHWELVDHWL